MAKKYKNNLYIVSDFIEPGTYNEDAFLTMGVTVPFGRKMAPRSLVVGTDEALQDQRTSAVIPINGR
jgi:hypothetical protein